MYKSNAYYARLSNFLPNNVHRSSISGAVSRFLVPKFLPREPDVKKMRSLIAIVKCGINGALTFVDKHEPNIVSDSSAKRMTGNDRAISRASPCLNLHTR